MPTKPIFERMLAKAFCQYILTLCAPPLSVGGGVGWGGVGGVEPPTKFSKRGGGLRGPQLLEGVAGKEGVTFFRGFAIFT